jgi:hypothetical protein
MKLVLYRKKPDLNRANDCFSQKTSIFLQAWRDGRVAEGARLESVYTATYRGFESLSLRQYRPNLKILVTFLKPSALH